MHHRPLARSALTSPLPKAFHEHQRCVAGRQVHAGAWPCVPDRRAGPGSPAPCPEAAGQPQWPSHRRLHFRLSRVPAGHLRRRTRQGCQAARESRYTLRSRRERRPCRHRGMGHATGGDRRRGQVRRRVFHLVWQGPRGGPLGRRLQAWQPGRHRQAWRRAGPDGGRPYLRIVHHLPSVGVRAGRRQHSGPQPVGRRRTAGIRPVRLGAVALFRLLGRNEMREGKRRCIRFGGAEPGAGHPRARGSGLAGRRCQYPAARYAACAGIPAAQCQDGCGARIRAGQSARPHHARQRGCEDRHHYP